MSLAPASTHTTRLCRSISACEYGRKLPGRSQAHLLEGEDGHWYVTKFQNNPQGVETLINEVVSTLLLERLGIRTPSPAFLQVPSSLLEPTQDISLRCGSQRVLPATGWHWGSQHVGHPDIAVYDFLPSRLLPQVRNLSDFVGILVYDFWSCHRDARQAVFHRSADGFRATFIDHGSTCGGAHWQFHGDTLSRHSLWEAYDRVRSWQDLAPWVEQIESWTQDDLHAMADILPTEWVTRVGEARLRGMLDTLCDRRLGLADRLRAYLAQHPTVLPRYAQPITLSVSAERQILAASA